LQGARRLQDAALADVQRHLVVGLFHLELFRDVADAPLPHGARLDGAEHRPASRAVGEELSVQLQAPAGRRELAHADRRLRGQARVVVLPEERDGCAVRSGKGALLEAVPLSHAHLISVVIRADDRLDLAKRLLSVLGRLGDLDRERGVIDVRLLRRCHRHLLPEGSVQRPEIPLAAASSAGPTSVLVPPSGRAPPSGVAVHLGPVERSNRAPQAPAPGASSEVRVPYPRASPEAPAPCPGASLRASSGVQAASPASSFAVQAASSGTPIEALAAHAAAEAPAPSAASAAQAAGAAVRAASQAADAATLPAVPPARPAPGRRTRAASPAAPS